MALTPARLEINYINGSKQEFLILEEVVSIGRATDNTLCLDLPDVSRHHVRIIQDLLGYAIVDLGSAGGTRVSGSELQPRVPKSLENGSLIQIGSFDLRFYIGERDLSSHLQTQPSLPSREPALFEFHQISDTAIPEEASFLPVLQVVTPTWTKNFPLEQDRVLIGRNPSCDIAIDVPVVSSKHAQLNKLENAYEIIDLKSTNGLLCEGKRVDRKVLKTGDMLYIDINVSLTYWDLRSKPAREPVKALSLRDYKQFSLGRDSTNNAAIDHPSVSRIHALIEYKQGSPVLTDLNSTNGTFVNGKRIEKAQVLKVGDVIRIGSCCFILNMDETLTRQDEAGNLRLDAFRLTKIVGKGIAILNDVSLSILPKEFVAIAGVSGGGKSTLLNALNGFRPASSGIVFVNRNDLYRNFNAYRMELGYVPQKDIVHSKLTVFQALDFAAQLRMSVDITPSERYQRIQEVLEDLGLAHRQDVAIEDLSGGQLKRVSMGVELLTKPSLFFLDEATSGLDPGTEADIMRLLRKLADQGRTILLITHATENVMLCDLVVFLAAGGRVAYFGPPDQALAHFKVSKFNEIYPKVERELSPQMWEDLYKQSPQYQQYVCDRQAHLNISPDLKHTGFKQQAPTSKVKSISAWQQFLILSQRNIAILLRDRASLILMLAIAPILGLLDFVTWKRDIFDTTHGDPGQVATMLFNTSLIAVMVGSLATMREIVKEVDIYQRERMIGLMSIPYILSKIWFCVLLAIYQSAIFLLFKYLAINLPGDLIGIYITIFLTTLAGMVMGLLVSAASPNQNIAPLLTIIFLVPQIIFGGGVLPVHNLGTPGQIINQVSLTKWSFEALVTLTGFGSDVAKDPCWNKDEDTRKKLTEDEKNKNCQCLGTNLFSHCQFPGLKSKFDAESKASVEATEPIKPDRPKSPGDPPTSPAELAEYQERVSQFNADMKVWEKDIETWQKDFSKWKEKREGAIGGAEAAIARFHKDFGFMFHVNVTKHWGALVLLIGTMFGALVVVQKRKG